MKVRLLKDFGSQPRGAEITMHPFNARIWFTRGVCTGVTPDETEYLRTGVVKRESRKRRVERVPMLETQMVEDAQENALKIIPAQGSRKPRRSRKKPTMGASPPA